MLSCECRTFRCHQAMKPSVCECVFEPEAKRTSQKVVHTQHFEEFEFPKNEKQIFQTFIMFVQLNIYFMKLDVLGGSVCGIWGIAQLGQDTSRMGCIKYFQHTI